MKYRVLNQTAAAQALFQHGLATQEQMVALWPAITPDKDIAALLVENGVLTEEVRLQLLTYLATQGDAEEIREIKGPDWLAAPHHGFSSAEIALEVEPTAGIVNDPTYASIPKTAHIEKLNSWNLQANLHSLFGLGRQQEISDLHLSSSSPIYVKKFGRLEAVTSERATPEQLWAWIREALSEEEFARFEKQGDLETVVDWGELGRYRVACIKQRRGPDLTARFISTKVRTFEESGLPESCRELCHWAQGLVLVTGPAGCGKSTTLATLVEMVNQSRHDHIISLEDPIEFVFKSTGCKITQRHIGVHSKSREAALRAALREDPDIIVISELRDLETIQLAVSAAETGHLVFASMNTINASRTIYRLIDSFPPEEQPIIRNMVSESLRGVVSQQLIPRKDKTGVVPAFEVLLVNSAVANMIRKDEAHQLGTAMITGKGSGMVLLDDSLRRLVETGQIEGEDAYVRANQPKDFERYLGRK